MKTNNFTKLRTKNTLKQAVFKLRYDINLYLMLNFVKIVQLDKFYRIRNYARLFNQFLQSETGLVRTGIGCDAQCLIPFKMCLIFKVFFKLFFTKFHHLNGHLIHSVE